MTENRKRSAGGWILVVDDDTGLRELIVRVLEREGHVARAAANGKEAIDLVAEESPLLMLLDYRLTDMTGMEVVTALTDRDLSIPFIMMTGQGDERLAVEIMKMGAADYMVKDTDLIERLPAVVDRVLRAIEMNDRLRAAEAEKEKLQAQLAQAQKMESVGRLAGGVAHDFNNMLGVIMGHAELALDHIGTDAQLCAHLDEIQTAARRSAELTRQLLAFARKQTVTPKVLDLNETVEGMLKMLGRLIGENIELVWRPGGGTGSVFIDPSQVDQILANLCVNARDAIADTGRITIETCSAFFDEAWCADHPDCLSGEFAMLAVSDDGCGMDAEIVSHLFEPFFTTKAIGKGTGLGLATVYGAVRQNNGFISVYSEPGHGTTFRIYLPRHAAKAVGRGEQQQSPARSTGGETILLVEDESIILQMTTMMLEGMGYAVIPAATPGEAMRLARECRGRIDLLMTDVIMPEMNGRDLARNLLSLYPDMGRLFMSGYTADVIAHHGVLDTGVHFIQKPFSMKELGASVRKALRKDHCDDGKPALESRNDKES